MKICIKVTVLACLLLFVAAHTGYGQNVGINNPTPNASAMLDITSTNKGLLVPRVALTATNVAAPVTTPATSLLIYNTATAGTAPNNVVPGFYYWNGTQWVSLLINNNGDSKSWLTTGNAGTVDGTHFIGTTDNVPLNFRINNQKAGRIDGTLRNVFLGRLTGNANTTGTDNVFMGDSAGNSNTGGRWNTATGSRALSNNIGGTLNTANGFRALYSNSYGFNNTASGSESLYNNTGGTYNSATGYWALFKNTLGNYNTADGFQALYSNTVGEYNTANGVIALYENTIGDYNSAVGYKALYNNNTGSNNTGIGRESLVDNNVGTYNTAIGANSGNFMFDGDYNSFLGAFTQSSGSGLDNITAIGARASVAISNAIVLGSVAGINGASASVNVGIGETAPASDLHIRQNSTSGNDRGITLERSTGTLWRTYVDGNNLLTFEYNNSGTWGYITTAGNFVNGSDRRLKRNITTAPSLLAKIMQLKPSMYHYLNDADGAAMQYGFIAQEVQPLFPEMVTEREDGMLGIAYSGFSVVAIKAIQEQQVMIDALKAENVLLKQRLDAIEAKLK